MSLNWKSGLTFFQLDVDVVPKEILSILLLRFKSVGRCLQQKKVRSFAFLYFKRNRTYKMTFWKLGNEGSSIWQLMLQLLPRNAKYENTYFSKLTKSFKNLMNKSSYFFNWTFNFKYFIGLSSGNLMSTKIPNSSSIWHFQN